MKFQLQEEVELSELQMGVFYNWTQFDNDCQHEPLSLVCEGSNGLEEDPLWRVQLVPINDAGYKLNSITVYGCSF